MRAEWIVRRRIRAGDVGAVTRLHGILYAAEYGYDTTFEAYVAGGLADFVESFRPKRERIWLVEAADRLIGSVAIVGRSATVAQLRWLLVDPGFRGRGIGGRLLTSALRFCRSRRYRRVFLWTTDELKEAGRLYARFGFRKTEEKTHTIWGKRVTEQRYDLRL